jgi:hypothetical protein
MAEVQWYYARNDQQFGPVSAAELKQLAEAGRLSPDDLLWREGMEQWTTAVNLRGLFATEDVAAVPSATPRPLVEQPLRETRPTTSTPNSAGTASPRPPVQGIALRGVLRTTQLLLWTTCVLVVLVGMVLFTRAFLTAETAAEEASAAAVFATFFIGAYVLARCGEKLAGILLRRGP